MIGVLVAVILGILLIGLVLKVIKIAIILAICVGLYMVVQNKFSARRLK